MTREQPHLLARDIETRSTTNLKDVGAHKYATHPHTEVLCVGYCADDEPVKLWRPGEAVPPEFMLASQYPDEWKVVAHNAPFEMVIERHILSPRYGFPIFPLEQNLCTMAIANALALPASLGNLAKVLNLTHRKDAVGERVMLPLAKPRKAREGECPDTIHWFDDEERMQRLFEYCQQDVEATREVALTLPWLSREEHAVWVLDQRINNCGIHLDLDLINAARRIVVAAHLRINNELVHWTNNKVTKFTQVAQLKKWLAPHCGPVDLDKESIEELLDGELPDNVRRVLELRHLGAQAAVAKVDALLDRRQQDGRLRGAFVYHAAGTGRWSSRGAQVHNLKRPTEDVPKAVEIIGRGDFKLACRHYDNPLSVIGDLVRAMICAAPGHVLIGGDFSGIEARVTAWLADEHSALEVFRRFDASQGADPYIVAAAQIFRLDPDELAAEYKAGKPEAREQRQVGKAATLAFGFEGGVRAYRKFAPDALLSDAAIDEIKLAWRRAHPNIERFWHAINRAAWYAVRHPGDVVRCGGKITLECDEAPFLKVTLPSGRELSYPHARIVRTFAPPETKIVIETERGEPSLIFKDNSLGAWRDVRTYGGYWTQNLAQAIARDLLVEAMLRIDAAKLKIVSHTHDECTVEVPKKDVAWVKTKFTKLMMTPPDWGEGIPIVVTPWVSERYVK